MYVKATWEHVLKRANISIFFAEAMFQGFDQTWGARNVVYRRDNMNIAWNWKHQCNWVAQLTDGQFGVLGVVVLGLVGPRVVRGGVMFCAIVYVAVFHVRGPRLPSK